MPEHHEAVIACAEIEQAGGSCDGRSAPLAAEPDNGAATPAPDLSANPEGSAGATDTGDEDDGSSEPGATGGESGSDGDGVESQTGGTDTAGSGNAPGSGSSALPAGAIEPGEESIQGIDLADYDLLFADEFQTTTLDSTKWKTALEWGPDLIINDQFQYYVDVQNDPDFGYDPFVFDGETIGIRAQRTPDNLLAAANDQPWLSGVLSAATRFDIQYGYIEARIDLPTGNALWPAFWMLPLDPSARSPRLFIAEYDGDRPESVFHDYQYLDDEGNLRSPGQFQVDEPSLSDGFHTVGVSWTPDELVFYLDGTARFRIVGDQLPAEPLYPILSLAIGGTFTGTPNASTPAAPELLIDYVRLWQRR